MSTLPKAGIIVLSYNGERFLPKCLKAIAKTNYPQESLVFFLVDNGSNDSSSKILENFQRRHPELNTEVILNNKNFGFAAGNNVGFEAAARHGLDYVTTLNQDIQEVDPDWLGHLVKTLDSDSTIAIAQARLMRYPDKNIINSIGNKYHFLGFGVAGGNGEVYEISETGETKSLRSAAVDRSGSVTQISYASGGAMLVRLELIKKYGGFQAETFMYHDDLELSLRFRLLGYKIVCNYESVVYHQYEFHRSIKKYYWLERNRLWVMLVYYKIWTLILILPVLLVIELGLLIFSIKRGFFRDKLKSYGYFLWPWNWFKILKRRQYIQSIRKVGDRELLKLATGTIEDQEIKNLLLDKMVNPITNAYWQIVRRLI